MIMHLHICVYVYMCMSPACHLLFLAEQSTIKIPLGPGEMAQWLKCLQNKQKDQSSNPQDPCKCPVDAPTSP